MNTKQITATSLIALVAAGSLGIAVSAQTESPEAAISAAQAIEIALGEVAGEVREVELETEDGTRIYEIEILAADGTEMDVEISADTGEILLVAADEDDDDDDHDDDEDDDDDYDDDDEDDDDDDDDEDDD